MKTALGIALVITLLAVAYYFGVALPAQDKAKLQLDREKFEQELKEKKAKEQEAGQKQNQWEFDKQNAETAYRQCLVEAEHRFNRDLELNGTPIPGKKDSYDLPTGMLKDLHRQQNDEDEACRKEYELTLKTIEAK
jgi:hypothetical protein